MKKMMSILMSMMMLLAGAALAEDSAAIEPITGTIVEVREDGSYIIQEYGKESQVHVLVNEETVIEPDWQLQEGDVIIVTYDGRMTRSMPGQIHAEIIRSYTMEGKIVQIDEENNRVLMDSEEAGQVWATLPEGTDVADFVVDGYIRIYTNGVMALSFPGQVFVLKAEAVVVETGKVTEIGTDYFMLDWNDSTLRVNFDLRTKVINTFDEGDEVVVYYNGMMARSMPGQIFAIAIAVVPEVTE